MNFFNMKTFATIAAATALTSAPAIAQQAMPQQQRETQIERATDAELDKFLAANGKVKTIATDMQSELETAESQAEATEITKSAEKDMIDAIEEEGLTTNRFNEIVRMAQTDPETNQRLRAELEG